MTKKNSKKNICRNQCYGYKLGLLLLALWLGIRFSLLEESITSRKIITDFISQSETMSKSLQVRSIIKNFVATQQEEGVGATVRRSIGTMQMRRFSPFLMLDHFTVSPPAGFPDHPHHGQETITYMLGGMLVHEDFSNSKGILSPGDLQFMTAGKAIIHSEIPVKMDSGQPAVGLQLWVDLPEKLKNCEPRYRDLKAKDIPVIKPSEHLKVTVISGTSYGVQSVRDLAYTPVHYYHFATSKKGTEFVQEFPRVFNAFMYILKGSIGIGEKLFPQFSTVFFDTDGDAVEGFSASDNAEFVLIGGEILHQDVVQHGPFVETNRERLIEVFHNYQNSINGFDRGRNWRSTIAGGITESEAKKELS